MCHEWYAKLSRQLNIGIGEEQTGFSREEVSDREQPATVIVGVSPDGHPGDMYRMLCLVLFLPTDDAFGVRVRVLEGLSVGRILDTASYLLRTYLQRISAQPSFHDSHPHSESVISRREHQKEHTYSPG